jgi:hypothetical protein
VDNPAKTRNTAFFKLAREILVPAVAAWYGGKLLNLASVSGCLGGEFPPASPHSDTPVSKLGIWRGFSQLTFANCRR